MMHAATICLAMLAPGDHRPPSLAWLYRYHYGCGSNCQHCQSCRRDWLKREYDYRRHIDYPWRDPRHPLSRGYPIPRPFYSYSAGPPRIAPPHPAPSPPSRIEQIDPRPLESRPTKPALINPASPQARQPQSPSPRVIRIQR